MEITVAKSADVVTLRLSGKLDATVADAFEEQILGQIDAGERLIVVDLARLDYIASAGLRVLAFANKRLNSTNGRMAICSLQEPVKEVFDVVGFLTPRLTASHRSGDSFASARASASHRSSACSRSS
jgi:anti-anti-sigma factor